jgi:hypothetical protein
VADKPEFVDMISEATRQVRRRVVRRVVEPEPDAGLKQVRSYHHPGPTPGPKPTNDTAA